MSDFESGTTGLNWENSGEGHWRASANGTIYEAIKQGGNWVLWVNGACHYDRYHFLADAVTEAETLAAAPAEAPAPVITRADLDWLCITHRAAADNTGNGDLWLAAVRAMRHLIGTFDIVALDDRHAAHAQYLVNRLAAMAGEYATQGLAVASERLKDVLEAIGRGERLDAFRLL